MHWIDILVLALYVGFLIFIGLFRHNQSSNSPEEFILAGRSLTLPAFTATLVTTWYGGILGIGENTFLYGVQTWFIFGLPYYIFATMYAFWIAPKIRSANHFSIPDHFNESFGKTAGILSAFYIFILSSPAPYILSMGILIQFIFHIPFWISMVLASLFSLIYIWFGGFKAIIRTDIFQFIFMFLGFGLLLTYCWAESGSPLSLLNSLPEKHVTPLGGNTIQYVIVWFFIASWTFIDPGFYQRCAAAKTPEIAQKGILLSIVFWGIFDALTLMTGLYAVQLISPENPLFSFPLLGKNILPPLVYGIFIAGIFSTIMSTIDSLGFVNSFTFGRDIVGRLKEQSLSIKSIRMGLIVSTLLAWGLALILPSVVKLFYTIGSIIIPGLIFPFLLNIWKPKHTFSTGLSTLWIFLPVIISTTWMGLSLIIGQSFLNIEPFYPGMASSFLIGYFIIK